MGEPLREWTFAAPDGAAPRAIGDVYAVGRNYADHVKEMGGGADAPLVVFVKARAALAGDGMPLVVPRWGTDLQYEGELVVLVGRAGRDIPAERALEHVWGYAAGIDWTLRDLQRAAREAGEPWFPSKNFPGAAAVGPFAPRGQVAPLEGLTLRLTVNGVVRQETRLGEMRRPVAEIVAELSRRLPLSAGDAIFTGTPAGVGRAAPDDVVTCAIDRVGTVTTPVRRR